MKRKEWLPLLGGVERQAQFFAFMETAKPGAKLRDLALSPLDDSGLKPMDFLHVIMAVKALMNAETCSCGRCESEADFQEYDFHEYGLKVTHQTHGEVTVGEVLRVWDGIIELDSNPADLFKAA